MNLKYLNSIYKKYLRLASLESTNFARKLASLISLSSLIIVLVLLESLERNRKALISRITLSDS